MRGRSVGQAASPIQRVGVSAATATGGPTLIARRFFTANATDTVPAGATRATARCVGGGGSLDGNGYQFSGGGGAYARDDIACVAGQSATVVVGRNGQDVGGYGTDGEASSFTLPSGRVSAAGGKAGATGSSGGLGGRAADCVGSVKRSGGDASRSLATSSYSGAGDHGGAGAPSSTSKSAPGASAGDIGDADSLGIGGSAVSPNATPIPLNLYGSGPCTNSNGILVSAPGLAVIEYWSA